MIQPSDRKIMMLQKMIARFKRQVMKAECDNALLTQMIKEQQGRIATLIGRIRGNGAKAPVPDDLLPCYDFTLNYVTNLKYRDKTKVSMFKNVNDNQWTGSYAGLKGHIVVDWLVERLDEGLYDLVLEKEWVY